MIHIRSASSVGVVTLAVVLAACSGVGSAATDTSATTVMSTTSTTAAPTPPSPDCQPSEIDLSLGTVEGAAGSTYTPILFHNVGTRGCILEGFPDVSYVTGAAGTVVGESAVPSTQTPAPVLIAPGSSASVVLQQARPENFPQANCVPQDVGGILVTLPGQSVPVFLDDPTTACSVGADGRPTVSDIQSGTSPTF